ncbi:MAG: hypothetical protein ABEJ28_09370 [Salinigranum sp.]
MSAGRPTEGRSRPRKRTAHRERSAERNGRRAQTTLDFAIGAGVFLLAVAFAVSFIPGMIQPFAGDQSRVVAADQAADRLVGGLLGAPDQPYLLNETCTSKFFTGSPAVDCRFAHPQNLSATFGPDVGGRINVTVENETGVVDLGTGWLTLGDAPPSSRRVVTAQRTVWFGGRTYTLYVREW